jgi:hypothetical protein
MFKNVGVEVFGGNEDLYKQSLVRNLAGPLTKNTEGLESIYGSVDDQLATYARFEENYRLAIQRELSNTSGLSVLRRRQLQSALDPKSSIDLNLINSLTERRTVLDTLMNDVIKPQAMIRNFGLPGIYLPSSNPNRLTAKLAVSTEAGYEPILDILQQATFSIDPRKEVGALRSFRISTTSLPSLAELRERVTRARVAGSGYLNVGSLPAGAKLFFGDTETTGVTDIDIVRSISMKEGSIGEVGGVRQITLNPSVELGSRFKTAELSGYVAADPHDLRRVTGLDEAVIARETKFGTSARAGIDPANIFDLKTAAGRAQAKSYYENLFSRLSADDSYFVAYNGQFDVGLMARSARSVNADEAIIGRFEQRMRNGGLVDVLGLVKERLNNQLASRIASSGLGPNERAVLGIQTLLSDQALSQARLAGEAVKPFGLENVIQSTNFLEILGREAEAGNEEAMELFRVLSTSQASHIDTTDTMVTKKTIEYLQQLDWLDDSSAGSLSESTLNGINAIRINTQSSRAIVATVNLADPRYLPEVVYRHLLETQAINNVQLDLPLASVVPGAEGGSARLKFDPDTGSFRLFTPGEDPLVQTSMDLPDGFGDPRAFIRRHLERIRSLGIEDELPVNQPTIQTLGITPVQARNITETNAILMGGNFNTAAGSLTEEVNKAALIDALGSTREHIGYNTMDDPTGVPPGIARLMRSPHDPISQAARQAYRDTLSKIGIASASMDPRVRSTMVGISEITADLTAQNVEMIESAMRPLVPGGDAAEVSARALAFQDQLKNNVRYLSDLETITVRSQKAIVATDNIALLPQTILEQAETLDEAGNRVAFFSDQALNSRSNRVRFSIANRASEEVNPTVNLIYGGGVKEGSAAARRASVEAESIYDVTSRFLASGSPEEMQAAGLNTAEQIAELRTIFAGAREAEGAEAFEKFRQLYFERGVGIGTIEKGEGAEGVVSMLRSLIGSVQAESDELLLQKGAELELAGINREFATLYPRLSDEAHREAARVGTDAASDLVRGASATSRLERFKSILREASQDTGLFPAIRARFGRVRVDDGIGGTGILADRLARDEHIRNRIAAMKPSIYTAIAGVAALSAGYYIGKKSQQNELYNEVMEAQPTENNIGQMSIRDFNQVNQQITAQNSARRDPLVTAGVVGNLDRNKVSHYKMGPGKYNHLYGS